MFCVFEGLDGSGKTTLIRNVATRIQGLEWFKEHFSGLELLKEPTDLEKGLLIREMLRGGRVPGRLEWLELFLSDRADNVGVHIAPGLNLGKLLLQDRYYWSTAAYQGRLDATPTPMEIIAMNEKRGFPAPEILFYLELSPEQSMARARARGAVETFETLDQLRKIHRNYESIVPPTAIRLDAELPTEELVDNVMDSIQSYRTGAKT